jgi:hypothetical protein
MSITVNEQFGRRLGDKSSEYFYLVLGTTDAADAKAAAEAATATTRDGLHRDDVSVEELAATPGLEGGAVGGYIASVRYARAERAAPEVGDLPTYQFETRGGTQHITQSKATVNSYVASGTAPNFKGAIGVTDDTVEGTDIVSRVFTFSETHYLDDAVVTATYKGQLFGLTGKTNAAIFRDLAIGECLFLGAAGSRRGDGPWELSFAFAASPNLTGLTVGDITSIVKAGWDYLWVRYQDVVDTSAKMLVRRPLAVFVERVYGSGDYDDLGI